MDSIFIFFKIRIHSSFFSNYKVFYLIRAAVFWPEAAARMKLHLQSFFF